MKSSLLDSAATSCVVAQQSRMKIDPEMLDPAKNWYSHDSNSYTHNGCSGTNRRSERP
jgi:hypothetical protein